MDGIVYKKRKKIWDTPMQEPHNLYIHIFYRSKVTRITESHVLHLLLAEDDAVSMFSVQ